MKDVVIQLMLKHRDLAKRHGFDGKKFADDLFDLGAGMMRANVPEWPASEDELFEETPPDETE